MVVMDFMHAQANVNRLKAYRSNVVIFPRNAKKPKVSAYTEYMTS